MELDSLPAEVPRYLQQLGQNYDPELLEAMFSNRRSELNTRAVRVVSALGVFISAVARDAALGKLEVNAAKRGQELANLLASNGAAFVKVQPLHANAEFDMENCCR